MLESARATAATPPFFKPYVKTETNSQYVDGGLRHMCPVWIAHHESKLIWGDVVNNPPDLLLSIGGGSHVKESDRRPGSRSSKLISDASSVVSVPPMQRSGRPTTASGAGMSFRREETKHADRIWDEFISEGSDIDLATDGDDGHRRYLRISPALKMKVPKFDGINDLDDVEREAQDVLFENVREVREAAQRLVASSFYFEKEPGSVKQVDGGYTCTGEPMNSSLSTAICHIRSADSEQRHSHSICLGLTY
jgi:hypothetical protein